MRGGVFLKNDLNIKLISMEDIMARDVVIFRRLFE